MSEDQQEKRPTTKFGSLEDQWKIVGGKNEGTMIPDAQASKHSDVGGTKPLRKRQTVYMRIDLLRKIKHRIADSDEEISDVVNQALQAFFAKEEEA